MHRDAHRELEAVGEDGRFVGAAVAVLVLQNEEPIGWMSLITFRRKVRVAFEDPHAAEMIDIDPRRRDELRMLGEEFKFQAVIQHPLTVRGRHPAPRRQDHRRETTLLPGV